MSKSYKLKDGNYIDSTSIVHNRHILADIIYPVGSVYISINNTNPQNLFGGVWEQIKDRFLLACGDTYSNGSTGGEATHVLTENEMPEHNHWSDDDAVGLFQGWGDKSADGWVNAAQQGTGGNWGTGNAGGGQPHNNMPPYLAVFIWKRTA